MNPVLLELHIKDFAIIDQAYLELDKGLNVFTGETGAGKTLIVAAMNMLLGDRADASLVRSKCKRASIEGLFSFQNGFQAETVKEVLTDSVDDTVIAREILEEGKSKCYINDKIVSVGQLSLVGEKLVDLHGQHEHQSLLKSHNHLEYLDAFGGDEILKLKSAYEETYKQLNDKKRRFEELISSEQENLRRQDLLKFQIDEIEKANLKIGEDSDLEKERQILSNSEKLHAAASNCFNLISGSDESQLNALDLLREAISQLQEVKGIDEKLDNICASYESLVYTMEDFAQSVRDYEEQIEFDPSVLDEVESRLSLLSLLKKKYGNTINDILEYKDKAQAELYSIVHADEEITRLKAEILQEEKNLADVATALSLKRKEVAFLLQEEVQKHLSELNMPKVKFEISVSRQLDEFGLMIDGKSVKAFSNGVDKVEFFISPNPGEPLKPLNKIVSGGELSRIMLALKIVLANVDNIFTLIFDEIDAGIGGKTAFSVGQKLAQLAQNHQVICVTHLPQIASFADRHFYVSKKEKSGRSLTSIKILKKGDRLEEIARMLSGKVVSELSRSHAAEIIQKTEELKKTMLKGRACSRIE